MTSLAFYPSTQYFSPNKINLYTKPQLTSPLDSYLCDGSTDDENISRDNEFNFSEENSNENEVFSILNNKRQKTIIDETKFKTEMCKNWQTKGFCNYEAKCKFAHGPHELNKKDFVNKNLYKSKPCNSFHSKHFCPYGLRCLFIHQDKPLKQIVEKNFYTKQLNCLDFSNAKKNNKRLKCFVDHSSKEEKKNSFDCESKKLFHDDLWKIKENGLKEEKFQISCRKEVERMIDLIC